ncbi:MAG: cytochrome b/b6 domain-containing protein [Syntrophobacteraceae bacterium]
MIRESRTVKYLILTAFFAMGAPGVGSPAVGPHASQSVEISTAPEGPAQSVAGRPNPMHPAFNLLDAKGETIRQGGKEPDQIRTCGQCHSTAFITEHNVPAHQHSKATCLSCHYEGGKANWGAEAFESNGMVKREWIRISKPSISNCGICHGLTAGPDSNVSIPEDYRAAAYPPGSQALELERYQFTRSSGSIFSGQEVEASFLNLSGKQALRFPWDVHALKLMQCTDCHYAPNNPQRLGSQTGTAASLRGEPRRETVGEYLKQPDHRLATANCRTCHDPQRGHGFLPYPARHLEVVACESCHIPRQYGPAERMVDATLLDESGSPLVEYRGVVAGAANLNTAYARGSEPPPLPLQVSGESGTSLSLRPVNLVSRWFWTFGGSGEPIAREILQQALIVNGHYRPEVMAALDTNHDGTLDRHELKLDTESKRKTVERLLMAAGVKNPVIRSEVSVQKISHGVAGKSRALSDCFACHGPDSRLKDDVLLASWAPGAVAPVWKGETPVPGRIDMEPGGKVLWKPEPGVSQTLHVFGSTSEDSTDRLGLFMLIGVVLAVASHAGYRVVSRRGRTLHVPGTRREYLFTAYERIWHWVMALSVLALILTGIQIHFPGSLPLLGPANTVATHNFFAAVLALNSFLALFYHLTTAAIRQFWPGRKGVAQAVQLQTKYYLRDIFRGLPAPFQPSPESKLNVLQQITYLFLLNFFFPFQIITGIMIWLVGTSPAFAAAIGGLSVIAPLHNLGSWMFMSFLVAHIYLATTGHTVLAHVRGMMEGYEEVEVPDIAGGEKI